MRCRHLAAGICWLLMAAMPAAGQKSKALSTPQEAMRSETLKLLGDFQKQIEKPGSEPTVRELTHWAHAALALGMEPARAEAMVMRAMAVQEMGIASGNYGTVPWQEGHPEIADANAIEFTMLPVGPILLGYGDKLSGDFKHDMEPHIKAAIVAIRHHKVDVSYTNIYLMKTVNLLLLGEASGDASAEKEGAADLDAWIDFTRQNGVNEYDSATYSAVQIDDLQIGYIYAKDQQVKEKFAASLRYLWADVIASYFPARGNIAGSHSRAYDWVNDEGPLDRFYFLTGLSGTFPRKTFFSDATRPLVNMLEGGLIVDDETLGIAKQPQRWVRQHFGAGDDRDRSTYITPDFAIGSSSAFYCAHDNQFTIDLSQPGKTLPLMSVVGDEYDDPYGHRIKMKDGHDKPTHLKDAVAAVQDKGMVLALLDWSPGLKITAEKSVATNVLVPAAAQQILLDGKVVPMDQAVDLPAKVGSVVAVWSGRAAAAGRIISADGAGGQPVQVRFKWDQNKFGLARLVVYHYQGQEKVLNAEPVRSAVVLWAISCDAAEKFADFAKSVADLRTQQFTGDDIWRVGASRPGISLKAGLDLAHGKAVQREINDEAVTTDRLSINGEDMAARLLDPLQLEAP